MGKTQTNKLKGSKIINGETGYYEIKREGVKAWHSFRQDETDETLLDTDH